MQPAFLSRNCLHPKGSAPLLPPSPVMGVTAEFKDLALRSQLEISLKDHSSSRISCRTGWPCCSITMQFILFFYLILFPWLFSRWRFREHFPHTDFKVSHQLPGPALRKEEVSFTLFHDSWDAKTEGIHRKTWKGSQPVEYGLYQLLSMSG